MCFRPNLIGLLLLAAGVAFFISSAICSLWLLLLLGAACTCAGILFLKRK